MNASPSPTVPRPIKRLGESQFECLRSLAEDNNGMWWAGCGWLWDTYSGTERILRSMVKHGLVTEGKRIVVGVEVVAFTITEEGRERAGVGLRTPIPVERHQDATEAVGTAGVKWAAPASGHSELDRYRKALEAIRDGHSDPRALAREALCGS